MTDQVVDGPPPGGGERGDGKGDLDQAAEAVLQASRALLGVIAASLDPVLDRVTLPQFRVLVQLSALGPTRNGALADRLGVHPSTFTRTADRLVAAGYLRRLDNPRSRREILVDLTPSGRRLVTTVQRRRLKLLRAILTEIPNAERQSISEAAQMFSAAARETNYEELSGLLGL